MSYARSPRALVSITIGTMLSGMLSPEFSLFDPKAPGVINPELILVSLALSTYFFAAFFEVEAFFAAGFSAVDLDTVDSLVVALFPVVFLAVFGL